MARRRTGTLLLRKRDGKPCYFAQVTVDLEGIDADGKPKTKREWYSLETDDKAIAKRKLKKLVAGLATGVPAAEAAHVAGAPETVREFFDASKGRLAEGDRDNIRLHVLGEIGSTALVELRVAHAKAVRDAALETVRRETAGKVLGGLRRLLDLAIEDELVTANVAREIKNRSGARRRARGEEDADHHVRRRDRLFLAAEVDLEIRMMVAISRCIGGMRTSDLNTWSWPHVDTERFETCVVPRSKTAAPDELVIPESIRSPLRAWWERHGKPTSGRCFRCSKARRRASSRRRRTATPTASAWR